MKTPDIKPDGVATAETARPTMFLDVCYLQVYSLLEKGSKEKFTISQVDPKTGETITGELYIMPEDKLLHVSIGKNGKVLTLKDAAKWRVGKELLSRLKDTRAANSANPNAPAGVDWADVALLEEPALIATKKLKGDPALESIEARKKFITLVSSLLDRYGGEWLDDKNGLVVKLLPTETEDILNAAIGTFSIDTCRSKNYDGAKILLGVTNTIKEIFKGVNGGMGILAEIKRNDEKGNGANAIMIVTKTSRIMIVTLEKAIEFMKP